MPLAAGVLWLLEKMDSSVRGRLDLLKLTGIPPLALVPHIETDARPARPSPTAASGIRERGGELCVAVAITHFLYRPLDVLWFTFARRMGF